MRRYRAHLALVLLWFVLSDGYQAAVKVGDLAIWSRKMWAYMLVHFGLAAWCAFVLWKEWKDANGLFVRMRRAYAAIPVPRIAKFVFLSIFILEVVHISEGRIRYPFDDVGMFRYARKAGPLPTVLTLPKYYYKDDQDRVIPLEIRKQHIYFAADLLGLTYNNEFTFSATYHYKGEKANYDHLLGELKRHAGIDTLWVGLQTVDYGTGEVSFDPDPVRAVQFNDTAFIFYGPIHVPDHQRRASKEHGPQP